jgi:hypothetical protein
MEKCATNARTVQLDVERPGGDYSEETEGLDLQNADLGVRHLGRADWEKNGAEPV